MNTSRRREAKQKINKKETSLEQRDIKTRYDLEMERALPSCVRKQRRRWHMALPAVYVADCVSGEDTPIGSC